MRPWLSSLYLTVQLWGHVGLMRAASTNSMKDRLQRSRVRWLVPLGSQWITPCQHRLALLGPGWLWWEQLGLWWDLVSWDWLGLKLLVFFG